MCTRNTYHPTYYVAYVSIGHCCRTAIGALRHAYESARTAATTSPRLLSHMYRQIYTYIRYNVIRQDKVRQLLHGFCPIYMRTCIVMSSIKSCRTASALSPRRSSPSLPSSRPYRRIPPSFLSHAHVPQTPAQPLIFLCLLV